MTLGITLALFLAAGVAGMALRPLFKKKNNGP